MRVVLLGYGKMGKEIEKILEERGHEVVLKVTSSTVISSAELQKANVAIEFSTPHTVLSNIDKCFEAGLPIVVGTTGWYDKIDKVVEKCKQKNQTLFYASNFSLGVNLFFKLNTHLAKMMNHFKEYDVCMEEIHHIHKLDKPSGTAITLANQIIANNDVKTSWSIEDSKNKETLYIKDVREGEVPGTHIIKYQSQVDDIEIMHKAHNRKGFAFGAVLAAEFSIGKKGVLGMDDLLKL